MKNILKKDSKKFGKCVKRYYLYNLNTMTMYKVILINDVLTLVDMGGEVIAKLSPNATWIKEGDVVSDYELWWWSTKQNHQLFKVDGFDMEDFLERYKENRRRDAFEKVAHIKCPTCNNFH